MIANKSIGHEISGENLQVIHERREKYLSGKAKTYSAEEVREKALKKLRKKITPGDPGAAG